jgi:rhodanese-related sulfurtransferase/predicted metal-dependent enzyme (double-stranded beta helix superfamily)
MQLAPEIIDSTLTHSASAATPKTPEELAVLVADFAANEEWLSRVRFRAEGRWYERLHHDQDHDIWVISWLPGQSTGFHDHGASAGAFIVTTGELEEQRLGEHPDPIHPNQPRSFGPDYAHDVRNVSQAPAISIHAYSPPLDEMNEYELDGAALVPLDRIPRQTDALDPDRRLQITKSQSIEQILTAARARLRRLSPKQANDAASRPDTILVDIRPETDRALEGTIPGALIVERNVLEWRFDPTSTARLPIASHHNLQVIVVCSEGYTSSLAAASLQDLGLWRASDIIGGFQAWRAADLPIISPV